jgi:hypothetical protein
MLNVSCEKVLDSKTPPVENLWQAFSNRSMAIADRYIIFGMMPDPNPEKFIDNRLIADSLS